MARFVLDAFALLAYFKDEPGAARVQSLLVNAREGRDQLFMTVVNLGEVLYRLHQDLGQQEPLDALALILEWPLELMAVDLELSLRASSLKALYRLGYQDCFAAALAEHLDAAVVTGDSDFKKLPQWLLPVDWLPEAQS